MEESVASLPAPPHARRTMLALTRISLLGTLLAALAVAPAAAKPPAKTHLGVAAAQIGSLGPDATPAPPRPYVGRLCNTPCINERVPIQMDTAVDGFQKTISITGAVLFKTTPQLLTLAGNQEDRGILGE